MFFPIKCLYGTFLCQKISYWHIDIPFEISIDILIFLSLYLYWHIDILIYILISTDISLLTYWYIDIYIDILIFWYIDINWHISIDILIYWYIYWHIDILIYLYWHIDILIYILISISLLTYWYSFRNLSSNLLRLRIANHVKFTLECMIFTEKHGFVKNLSECALGEFSYMSRKDSPRNEILISIKTFRAQWSMKKVMLTVFRDKREPSLLISLWKVQR